MYIHRIGIKRIVVNKPKLQIRNIIFPAVMSLLGILVIFVTIFASTSGSELTNLEKREQILLEENRVLASKSAASSSLTLLTEKAVGLGFTRPESLMYLKSKEPVAQLR